jgi:hypothetical protein
MNTVLPRPVLIFHLIVGLAAAELIEGCRGFHLQQDAQLVQSSLSIWTFISAHILP